MPRFVDLLSLWRSGSGRSSSNDIQQWNNQLKFDVRYQHIPSHTITLDVVSKCSTDSTRVRCKIRSAYGLRQWKKNRLPLWRIQARDNTDYRLQTSDSDSDYGSTETADSRANTVSTRQGPDEEVLQSTKYKVRARKRKLESHKLFCVLQPGPGSQFLHNTERIRTRVRLLQPLSVDSEFENSVQLSVNVLNLNLKRKQRFRKSRNQNSKQTHVDTAKNTHKKNE